MERIPFDHLNCNLASSRYRKIFSANITFKNFRIIITLPLGIRDPLTEETGVQVGCTRSGVLHLWEQTPPASLCIVSRLLAMVKVVVR
jgi:hypothetical protein